MLAHPRDLIYKEYPPRAHRLALLTFIKVNRSYLKLIKTLYLAMIFEINQPININFRPDKKYYVFPVTNEPPPPKKKK